MNNFNTIFTILISLLITGCASVPSNVPYIEPESGEIATFNVTNFLDDQAWESISLGVHIDGRLVRPIKFDNPVSDYSFKIAAGEHKIAFAATGVNANKAYVIPNLKEQKIYIKPNKIYDASIVDAAGFSIKVAIKESSNQIHLSELRLKSLDSLSQSSTNDHSDTTNAIIQSVIINPVILGY